VTAPTLWVVGLPAWGSDALTSLELTGRQALASTGVVVGGDGQLAAVADLVGDAERVPLRADLSGLDAAVGASGPAAVVASGDPGFFGVLRALRARLTPEAARARLKVVPAVSSVSGVFAHAGLSWDDAVVLSAHGRDPRPTVNACRRLPKTAVLTSPEFGPADLIAALDARPRDAWIGERLGTPAAQIHGVRLGDGADPAAEPRGWADPNVVALVDAHAEAPQRTSASSSEAVGAKSWTAPPRLMPTGWGLADDAFAHRDGQVTKAEVRAQVLAWLGPGVGDLVWDVGCGSGSVGVECARLGAAVCAVDRDGDQVERARANAAAHGVPVDARVGEAPAVLAELPEPDAVFVGGGGANLPGIAAVAAARAHRAVVTAVAAVERVGPAWQALADADCDVDAVQLAASRLTALPGGAHRLAATNPVTLIRGVRP
jgi:precorrin-6Y C5,15-methyltransferase (decarboxylating)